MADQQVRLLIGLSCVFDLISVLSNNWIIYDLSNLTSAGLLFSIFLIINERNYINILFLVSNLLNICGVFTDNLFLDKYDTIFEVVHLTILIMIFRSTIWTYNQKD